MSDHDVLSALRLPSQDDAEHVELLLDDVTLGGYLFEAADSQSAVLILHGWGEDAAEHLPAARFFRAAGLHALSLSLRGWRGSSGCDDYGLRQPHDIVRAAAWLRHRVSATRVFLYGFSQGGLVALLAGSREADVAGIAVVNAPSELRSFARDTGFGGVRRYLNAVCFDGLWDERSPLHQADQLTVPTLLVASQEDTHVPPAQSRLLHERLPHGTLLEVPGADHLLDETQAQDVWRAALTFFANCVEQP